MENKALHPGSSAAADDSVRRSSQLAEQLADITAKVLRFTSAGGAAIAIVSGDVAVTRATSGDLAPDIDTPIRLEGSFAGLCIQQGELLYCEDAENDPRVDATASAAMGLRSMVMVPVGEKSAVRGVVAAFSAIPGGFRPTHIAVLRTLADIVHELIVREDQTKAAELPVQPLRRTEPANAPSASRPIEFSVAPEPLKPVEKFEPILSPPPVVAQPAASPSAVAAPAHEIAKAPAIVRHVERIPEPSASKANVVELPKPVIAPPPEAFKPVTEKPARTVEPEPKLAASVVGPPTQKEKGKDSLPSIVALSNQANRTETASSAADADVLVSAADPLLKKSAVSSTATGAATQLAHKSKHDIKEPIAAPKSADTGGSDTPMFRGLDHQAHDSSPILKYVGIAFLGVAIIGGTVWGVKSFTRKAQTQATAAQTEVPSVTPPTLAAVPDTTSAATHTAAPAGNAATSNGSSAIAQTVKPESTSAQDNRPAQPRKEAVIVSDKVGTIPHRTAQELAAPQVSLNSGGNLGALLTTTKNPATPTLSVKRSILSPPEVIRRVPPKFPEFARRTNPAGDRVVLNVTVGKDGRVGNVMVVRGQSMFSEAAINAVKQWQYRPAFLNGEAVDSTVEVVISFTSGR